MQRHGGRRIRPAGTPTAHCDAISVARRRCPPARIRMPFHLGIHRRRRAQNGEPARHKLGDERLLVCVHTAPPLTRFSTRRILAASRDFIPQTTRKVIRIRSSAASSLYTPFESFGFFLHCAPQNRQGGRGKSISFENPNRRNRRRGYHFRFHLSPSRRNSMEVAPLPASLFRSTSEIPGVGGPPGSTQAVGKSDSPTARSGAAAAAA